MAATEIDLRDVHVEVSFTEEEARFLAGAVSAVVDAGKLTDTQRAIASQIAGKFLLNGEAMKARLLVEYGIDACAAMADRAMAAYPDVEEVLV